MFTDYIQVKYRISSPRSLPFSIRILILGKHLPFRGLILPQHRLPPLLGPDRDVALERLRTHQEPLTVPRHIVDVRLDDLPLPIHPRLEVKRPHQLRDREEQVALRDVDARAQAPAGAVRVVVARLVVGRRREFGREGGLAFVMVWVEDVRVRVSGSVVVEAVDVDEDDRAFWEELAVDPVICKGRCLLAVERKKELWAETYAGTTAYPRSRCAGRLSAQRVSSAGILLRR